MSPLKNGKRILITGAAGGMGQSCASLAAKNGYCLLLADLPGDRLDTLYTTYLDQGVTAEKYSLDVTDRQCTSDMAARLDDNGGVDAVIHTVGVSPHMADWKKIIGINLIGTIEFLEAIRPALNSGSATLAISSSSAYLCPPDEQVETLLANPLAENLISQLECLQDSPVKDSGLAYAHSKKALQNYVHKNAAVWGAENKRLLSLSPGLIETDMGQLEYSNWDQFDAMKKRIALQRMGKPEDIANTALFLVSDEAGYINGCDILVDGGYIASFK